jgi:hypothetical protein
LWPIEIRAKAESGLENEDDSMGSEEPPPSSFPIVILMLIGLSGYMVWQFDHGLAKVGVFGATKSK